MCLCLDVQICKLFLTEIHTLCLNLPDKIFVQPAATCEGSDCSFSLTSDGTLTRSPSCNAVACTGILNLREKGIRQLDPNVFANMSLVTAMWESLPSLECVCIYIYIWIMYMYTMMYIYVCVYICIYCSLTVDSCGRQVTPGCRSAYDRESYAS
jgi:hypothetical protein